MNVNDNFGGLPLGQGVNPFRMNQRPISALISSLQVVPQKDGLSILISVTSGVPSSKRRTVFQLRSKKWSRSLASSLTPYPAPVLEGVPFFQAVTIIASTSLQIGFYMVEG